MPLRAATGGWLKEERCKVILLPELREQLLLSMLKSGSRDGKFDLRAGLGTTGSFSRRLYPSTRLLTDGDRLGLLFKRRGLHDCFFVLSSRGILYLL